MDTSATANAQAALVLDDSVTIIKGKHQGARGVIADISKGWVTVDHDDSKEELLTKHRIADLELWVEEAKTKTMAGTLAEARKTYEISISGQGRKSQRSPKSVVGRCWEGCDHGKVAQMAAILLGMEPLDLFTKYARLNNGQMRMNSGNRVNAAIKRGDIVEQDVVDALDYAVEGTDALDVRFNRL